MKKIIGIFLIALCIPYVATLARTGKIEGNKREPDGISRSILLDRGSSKTSIDLEEYLIGVLAVQVPADYEEETLKAQAIIARTYLYKQMGEEKRIPESSLDLDYLEINQLEEMWGKQQYLEYYKKLRDAVNATKGQTIQYEGAYIDPLFHRICAEKTRTGDELHPYLQSVDGHLDAEADEYMNFTVFTPQEFAEKLNSMSDSPGIDSEHALESVQIVEREEAGYVVSALVGSKSYTGEELEYALGLPSSAIFLEEYEGNIRCLTKGIGHGYGFDQYGANRKAQEGWKAEELLKFYYKNIVLFFE